MATQIYSNNANGTINSDVLVSDTVINLDPGEGALFTTPSANQFEMITITNGSDIEIVKMTNNTSDNLTVVRAQEGTVAFAFSGGDKIQGRLTAGALNGMLGGLLGVDYNTPDSSITIQKSRSQPWNMAKGADSISIGNDSTCTSTEAIAIGKSSYGGDGIALGPYAKSNGNDNITIGIGSNAQNHISRDFRSIAIGTQCNVKGAYSIGIGYGITTNATNVTALGAQAGKYSATAWSLSTIGLPIMSTIFQWSLEEEYKYYTSTIGAISSQPIDLSGGLTWAGTTTIRHGSIVQPTIPNGYQYIREDYAYDNLGDPAMQAYTPSSTGASEPTWPTTYYDWTADDGNGDYVSTIYDGLHPMPLEGSFMVEEVIFVVTKADTVTGQANISIGTSGDITKILNNQTTSGLVATGDCMKWTLTNPKVVPDITIKIDTEAIATQLLGYFVFKGFYVISGEG